MEDTRNATLQGLHDISTEELNWQLFEGGNSISALLAHAYAGSESLRIKFLENRELTEEEEKELLPSINLGKELPQDIQNHPLAYYLDLLETSKARLVRDVLALEVEDFYQMRDGYNTEKGCNLAWVIWHIVEDEINHRGQVALIRKMWREGKR